MGVAELVADSLALSTLAAAWAPEDEDTLKLEKGVKVISDLLTDDVLVLVACVEGGRGGGSEMEKECVRRGLKSQKQINILEKNNSCRLTGNPQLLRLVAVDD